MALTNKLKNIADSIRNKKGITNKLTLDEMANEIDTIKIEPILQDKSIEITENGTINITADEGYDGLNNVEVVTNVATSGGDDIQTISDCTQLFLSNRRVDAVESLLPLCKGATKLDQMFNGASNLKNDLSTFETGLITSMNTIFSGCGAPTLNLVKFNTSAITSMLSIFENCKSSSINVSSFDTSKVTSMQKMFYGCSNLTSLDLSNFDMSLVTNITQMFASCQKINELDISTFNTGKFTSLYQTFQTCKALKHLDLSHFPDQITNLQLAFHYCTSLETLDLSNFDLTKITNATSAFTNVGSNNATPTIVYVKDEASQNWVLTATNARPDTWTTDNVIIKG